MKRFSLKVKIPVLFLTFSIGTIAQNNFWQSGDKNLKTVLANDKRSVKPSAFKPVTLDTASLKNYLANVPKLFSNSLSKTSIIELPMPDGSSSRFTIAGFSVLDPALAAKYPEIKTFSGKQIDDPAAIVKLSWTYNGFYAIISSPTKGVSVITPVDAGLKTVYMAYNLRDLPKTSYIEANIKDNRINNDAPEASLVTNQDILKSRNQGMGVTTQGATTALCLGDQLYTYRIEISCTGEYAQALGQALGYGKNITTAQVLSDMVNKLNAININYERDLDISFILAANEDNVIFTDATTDPFSNDANVGTVANENQNVADGYIGTTNYDIGIALSSSQSGVAVAGVVCNASSKAIGCSGYANPANPHYVESICHEMGHEFGCSHSFNGTCGGGAPYTGSGVEPGSGYSIMSYAGGCDPVADYAIPYFHSLSRSQVYNYIKYNTGGSCAVISATGNTAPVVALTATQFYIPSSTPFTMTGAGSDPDGDSLTYMWEEFDAGTGNTNWKVTSGTDPLFRSFAPTSSPTRTFPKISDILTGDTTLGEVLPNYARDINLRLIARDNKNGGGGICSADAVVTVTNSSPFTVTSQATATVWTANGFNTATITWDVANTNGAPINCSAVDILLSTDGGYTYPYILAANTPNDGSEDIVIPNYNTPLARIMVRSVGNIFFNVNKGSIQIGVAGCNAEAASIFPDTSVTAIVGSAALNLSLAPNYASTLFSASGNYSTSDTASYLTIQDILGQKCLPYANPIFCRPYKIMASATGDYTFSFTGSGSLVNIYENSFDKGPNGRCQNLLLCNYDYSLGAPKSTETIKLNAGTQYVIVGQWWDQSFANDFSINVVGTPTGGVVYMGTSVYINPGLSYSYKYVIVSNGTGNIVAIVTTPDLSNPIVYPEGSYSVYGLSYNNTISASTLNAFVGGPFAALTNQISANPITFCASISKNSVSVQIRSNIPNAPISFGHNYTATPLGVYCTMYAGSTSIGNGGSVLIGNGGNWVMVGSIIGSDKGGSNAPNSLGRTEKVSFDGNGTYSGATTTAGFPGFVIDGYAASTTSWSGSVLPIGDASAAYPITIPANTALTAGYFSGSGIPQSVAIHKTTTTEYSPYIDFPAGIPAGNYIISYPAGFNNGSNNYLLSSNNTSVNGTNNATTYSPLSSVSSFINSASTVVATLPSTSITQLYFSTSTADIQPLVLSKFTSMAADLNCNTNLFWETSSERNNSYYVIEVSTDGINFSQEAKVISKNSLAGTSYNYSHSSGNGIEYFRLKMVGNDGSHTYSDIVSVTGSPYCNKSLQTAVFPNPTKGIVNVSGLPIGCHIGLYNAGGQKLSEIVAANGGSLAINLNTYASGLYILHIQETDGTIKYVKVIKE